MKVVVQGRSGVGAGSALASVAAAGGAALSVLCCVGPAVYGVLGAGGALAAARLAPYRPVLAAASLVSLGVGFWFAYYTPRAVRRAAYCPVRRGRWVRVVLWCAAAITAASFVVQVLLT